MVDARTGEPGNVSLQKSSRELTDELRYCCMVDANQPSITARPCARQTAALPAKELNV